MQWILLFKVKCFCRISHLCCGQCPDGCFSVILSLRNDSYTISDSAIDSPNILLDFS